ncbi:MAG: glycosyltransferase [Chloroflexi bacterium]|nr:glycosyltransferase [Chloroflexota bacterium]
MVQRGHHVTVYTTDVLDARARNNCRYDNLDGIEIYYLPNLSNWLAWNHKIFLPLGFRKMLKENINTFDVIHLSDFRTYPNAICYLYAKRSKIPYILSAYGSLPRATGVKRPVKQIYDWLFGYGMLHGAHKVVAQTENEAREYEKLGLSRDKIELITLGIDFSSFTDLPPRGAFRQQYGLDNNEKVVLFLGRIHEYKGLQLLVKAFAEYYRMQPNSRLVIVGRDDGYLSTIQNLVGTLGIGSRTIFLGPLYGQDKLPVYRDADVFALSPTHYEETSVAVLEACACGTPVIVTEQTSVPGLDEYEAGLTVTCDEQSLGDALCTILEDDQLRNKMGERARLLIEERFVWDVVIDKIERLYNSAATSQ